MMLQPHFSDPVKLKTKKIIFEDIFIARDSGTLEQLKELSSKRRIIEESINERSSITMAVAREMSGGSTLQCEQDIQKLEKYLPLLENFICQVHMVSDSPRMLQWTSKLRISWSSALTSLSFFSFLGQKFFQIDSLLFELSMMLFLNGALLREWAFELLSKDMVQSTTLFRRAAGVYHHLANEVLPSLQPALPPERPPEVTSSVCSVLSLLCLAEAQAVIIKKSEEKGNTQSLLAKLHYGVVHMLDEAIVLLQSLTEDKKNISVRFVEFLSFCKVMHELRNDMYRAESLKANGQIGTAIGFLQQALVTAPMNLPGNESWRLVLNQEADKLAGLLQKYEHENDFVWHDKVPTQLELPLPEGKRIVNFIPYHPQRWERAFSFKI
ncbi:uncharacterized protein LOC141724962 isoform X1 [Apium graveolens]|uniref:uncharacterized protein LOC141724962 isoform X1 n=1 Tax=Apium graveolens TaxID=4045 RepID=UPI003D79F3BC